MARQFQNQALYNKYDIKQSLLYDAERISFDTQRAFTTGNMFAVRAWGARIEAFDARVYPIIVYVPNAREIRQKLRDKISKCDKRNIEELKDAYMSLYRFLNLQLLRVDIYSAPDLTIEEEIPTWYYDKPKEKKPSVDKPGDGIQLLSEIEGNNPTI